MNRPDNPPTNPSRDIPRMRRCASCGAGLHCYGLRHPYWSGRCATRYTCALPQTTCGQRSSCYCRQRERSLRSSCFCGMTDQPTAHWPVEEIHSRVTRIDYGQRRAPLDCSWRSSTLHPNVVGRRREGFGRCSRSPEIGHLFGGDAERFLPARHAARVGRRAREGRRRLLSVRDGCSSPDRASFPDKWLRRQSSIGGTCGCGLHLPAAQLLGTLPARPPF